MDIGLLLVCGMVGLVGLLLAVLYFENAGKRRLAARARGRRQTAAARGPSRVAGPRLRLNAQGGFDAAIQRLLPKPEVLRARLGATGKDISLGTYAIVSIALPVVVCALLLSRGVSPVIAILVGAGAGLWIPHAVIGHMIKGRQTRFIKLFPDAIGLMVRGLRSGLPIVETMVVVGREVAEPVGEEFRRIGEQVKLGQTIQDAMATAGKRLNLPEFNFLVITFSVQRETGGNLAETLENLDDVLRKRQQMKLKIKAMSSEAVASASIIGCLPFVIGTLIFFVSHDYIMTLFHPGLGYILLTGGAIMITMGVLVMAKMVSFEI